MRPTLAVVLVLAAFPAAAQDPARFRPQPGTRIIEIVSSASVDGARNGDTARVRAEGGNYALQEWSWMPGDPPRLRVRSESLLAGGGILGEVTFTIDPGGALRAIDGRAVKPTPWNQSFPLLPADGRLEAGRTWTDSLSDRGTEDGRPYHGHSRLSYRVSRLIDTLGTRVAVIDADVQEVRRFGVRPGEALWPTRSADVAGLGRRTWWFDLRAGRLIELRKEEDLRGALTFAREGPSMFVDVDTGAGAIRSTELWREISPERAAMLRRIVTPVGLTYSMFAGTHTGLGAHQMRMAGDTVESFFLHGDRVTTARTVFREGRVVSHAWERVIGVAADGGVLAAPGHARNGAVPLLPPASAAAWAVAAPGMEEHLLPVLRAIPADSARRHRFAVYHPGDARWTAGSVQMVPLEWKMGEHAFPMTGAVLRVCLRISTHAILRTMSWIMAR